MTPSAACELQARLGADHAMAFDINGACSGFLFAIETADAFLQTGRFRKALVLGRKAFQDHGLERQEHLRAVRRRRGSGGA